MVHSKAFEAAIVKLCHNACELNNVEATSVVCFLITDEEYVSEEDLPAAAKAIKRRKLIYSFTFSNVHWVPATSNRVERFFSLCKQVYTKYRKRLLPINLEMQLFLKMHSEMWVDDGELLAKIYKSKK